MKNSLLVLTFLLMAATPAVSASFISVSGAVYYQDENTASSVGIPGARVTFVEHSNDSVDGIHFAFTDVTGNYFIELPSGPDTFYTVSCYAEGFTTEDSGVGGGGNTVLPFLALQNATQNESRQNSLPVGKSGKPWPYSIR